MKKLFALATLVVAAASSQAEVAPRTPVVPWGAQAEIIVTNDLTQQNSDGTWSLTADAQKWITTSYDGVDTTLIQQTNRNSVWFNIYDETTDTMVIAANHNWGGQTVVTSKSGSATGLIVVGKNRYPKFNITGTSKAKFYFYGSSGTAGYPQIEVYEAGSETPIATYRGEISLKKNDWDKGVLLTADNLDKAKSYTIVARTMGMRGSDYNYNGGDLVLQVVKLYGDQAPLRDDNLILSGSEIGGYINAYQAAKPGSHEFTLEGSGRYTIAQSIKTDGGFSLKGVADAPATIEADSLSKAFLILDGDTVQALNADSTVNSSYKYADKVEIANVNINNLQKALVQDNQKTLVENLLVDNVVLKHAGGNANIFNFNGKGYPANLKVTNSTLYSDTANVHKGYFLQASGRVRDLDGDQTKFKEKISIENSTISNIAVGQQFNNLRGNGQKSLYLTLKNSILNEVGKKGAIIRGWMGGSQSKNPTVVYENNTYMTGDSICTEWTAKGDGVDTTKTQLTTLPFKNGATKFTVPANSQQAKLQTGDPRWLVPYATEAVNITVKQTENKDFVAAVNEALASSEAPSKITVDFAEAGEYPTTGEINTTSPISFTASTLAPGDAVILAGHGMIIGGDITINGVDIKADTLKTPFITLQTNEYKKQRNAKYYNFGSIKLSNMKATGMKGDFIYGNKKANLINEIETKNCIIVMGNKGKTVYNFNGGGVVKTWNFVNSTLDAAESYIFSSQSGTKATEYGVNQQTFNITNSNIIRPAKKAFQHRQNSQKWLRYILKNSVIVVNKDKPNFVAEMNAGSTSSTPVWEISGNAFQQLTDTTNVDVTDKQNTGDANEAVQNSVKGIMAFTSTVDPLDLGGTFTLPAGADKPESLGDPRWTINFVNAESGTGIETAKAETVNLLNTPIYNLAGQRVNKSYKGVVIVNGKKFINK